MFWVQSVLVVLGIITIKTYKGALFSTQQDRTLPGE